MHIPDGFISTPLIWGGCFVASASVLALAGHRTSQDRGEFSSVLPGMTGSFLFAAQMFNFPVAAGTSGHLLGGVLACALLGGWGGMLVMALVLTVQCLIFQDGGITALGANILNMAVIGGGGGFLLFKGLERLLPGTQARLVGLGVASGVGVMLAALAAAAEIGLSGVVPLGTALGAMAVVHIPIGIIEGLATASIVGALTRLRPELLRGMGRGANLPVPLSRILPLMGVIVACAALAVGFASQAPDGLERVAELLGFSGRATSLLPAPFADYDLSPSLVPPHTGTPFITAARVLIALGGTALMALLIAGLVRLLRVLRLGRPAAEG